MNAVSESRSADESIAATLARARVLIEKQNFDSAIQLYTALLEAHLPSDLRSEVETNLAAALCTLAQGPHAPKNTALGQLDRARELLNAALRHRRRTTAPREWAASRANLALVHMARYEVTRNENDVLSAHLALDGTEDALDRAGEGELLDWVAAIRDHLLDLRDRRARRR
ncbi:hypothetical protein [Devosia sp.]|uniref:hypothetical protein n=1 Tax=Devosia sp. TaxID=1871048 RepID=UPI002FC95DE2